MLKIISSGRLPYSVHTQNGDTLRLHLDDELVHSFDMTELNCGVVTHWACFTIAGKHVAYAIGDSELIADLTGMAYFSG